jgi:hypothetical protein
MIAQELINYLIPPLKPTDDGHKAMVWMEEFRCKHLPVVDKGRLLGFLSEDVLLESNNIGRKVKEFDLTGQDCTVSPDRHVYDVLRTANECNLPLVAVVSAKQHYEGVITVQDMMSSFAQTMAVQLPGGILVLSLDLIDYSLAEISRLIEENNAKVLSSILKEDPLDKSKVVLTLKINQVDLSRIVATLDRFGYRVIGRYQEIREMAEDRDRIDMLMRYLDI